MDKELIKARDRKNDERLRAEDRIAELEEVLRKWLHWSFQYHHGAHPYAGETSRLLYNSQCEESRCPVCGDSGPDVDWIKWQGKSWCSRACFNWVQPDDSCDTQSSKDTK